MNTATDLPAATVTPDLEGTTAGLVKPSSRKGGGAYVVACEGFEFHVMRFGRKWEIDGRDPLGGDLADYLEACEVIEGADHEHNTLKAAVTAIRKACS